MKAKTKTKAGNGLPDEPIGGGPGTLFGNPRQ